MMDANEHIAEAQRLLESRVEFYNGGQTRRVFKPSEADAIAALAHIALAWSMPRILNIPDTPVPRESKG